MKYSKLVTNLTLCLRPLVKWTTWSRCISSSSSFSYSLLLLFAVKCRLPMKWDVAEWLVPNLCEVGCKDRKKTTKVNGRNAGTGGSDPQLAHRWPIGTHKKRRQLGMKLQQSCLQCLVTLFVHFFCRLEYWLTQVSCPIPNLKSLAVAETLDLAEVSISSLMATCEFSPLVSVCFKSKKVRIVIVPVFKRVEDVLRIDFESLDPIFSTTST